MSEYVAHNYSDAMGRPEGGTSQGPGYLISWQRGPLKDSASGEEHPRNGAFVMDLIMATIQRIEFYQQSEFACDENAAALEYLYAAHAALQRRMDRRTAAGTQGTHKGK